MRSFSTALALLTLTSVAIAQTPITSLPYLYDWVNPAPLAKQLDGLTCVGGDGHWGCYIDQNTPMFVVDSGAGLVKTNIKDAAATLFTRVDATGRTLAGGEVFTFQATRNGGPTPTGTVQVYANSTLIKTINVTDLSTTMQSFWAFLPAEVGNSVFTISIVANTNKVVSFDNTNITGGALPITLASFKASFSSQSVTLLWSTLSEINNYGFYVQKSVDNTIWSDIPNSFQPGFGTTTDVHSYSFTDNTTPPGNYYRLRQVDLDGTDHISEVLSMTTAINPQPVVKEFALSQNYPNPFNPKTGIRFSVPTQSGRDGQVSGVSDVSLIVYDVLGREVAVLVNERKAAGTYEVLFDGTGLASGVYIYRLTAGQAESFVASRQMILAK
jgi:hypothetical protein